jgi:hypothetical protein
VQGTITDVRDVKNLYKIVILCILHALSKLFIQFKRNALTAKGKIHPQHSHGGPEESRSTALLFPLPPR